MPQIKLMTTKEAVARFVPDGATICGGNFLHPVPHALYHEVIRQRKRGLTLWCQSSIEEAEQLIIAGCLSRLVTSFNYRPGGSAATSHLEKAFLAGEVDLEDYSNYTLLMCLKAGAMGLPFLPVSNVIRETDIFRVRRFLGDGKFGIVKNPFDGSEQVVVPAVNPDVCLVHCQRADKYGNIQYWGPGGNVKWAVLASKHVIASVEQVVDTEVIFSSPELTVAPSFRVDAVVHEPWGGHPGEFLGCYNADMNFRSLFFMQANTVEGAQGYLDEWVYGVGSRREYLQHYAERFGLESLQRLEATTWLSAPANYGQAFVTPWDERGFSDRFQMTKDDFERLLEEKGELI